jgi:hypothetical protein
MTYRLCPRKLLVCSCNEQQMQPCLCILVNRYLEVLRQRVLKRSITTTAVRDAALDVDVVTKTFPTLDGIKQWLATHHRS